MKTKVFCNTTKAMMVIGGRNIKPGECRDVDERLHPDYRPATAAVDLVVDSAVEKLLKLAVKDIKTAIPELTDSDLQSVLDIEGAAAKPRKGVMETATAEKLARASGDVVGDSAAALEAKQFAESLPNLGDEELLSLLEDLEDEGRKALISGEIARREEANTGGDE